MEGAVCKQCSNTGRNTKLRLFQVNLEEAIWMCPSNKCTYPMGTLATSVMLVKRNMSEITNLKRRKVKQKRSSPANTAPPHLAVRPATNEAMMNKSSPTQFSLRATVNVAKSDSSLMVGAPDMTQKHTSYVADRRPRTYTASPVTSESSSSEPFPVVVGQNPGLVSVLSSQTKPVVDSTVVSPRRFLQWSNVDALCWMDVTLCLLVHCTNLKVLVATSGGSDTSLVRSLLVRYKEILALWDSTSFGVRASVKETKLMSLETSIGKVSVKTGGGGLEHLVSPPADSLEEGRASLCEINTSPVIMKSNRPGATITLETARRMLADVRDTVLACQPKLLCERGRNHSPVFALPLLLGNADQAVHDHFRVEYCWRMKCTQCHHCHEDRVAKTVPTFPAVPNDFSMKQPCFLRACFKCQSPGQRMNMHIDRMPTTLLVHFVEGLSDPQLTNYDFQFGGTTYAVTGLVQYKTKPDHFIAWIRDVHSNCWMMCDDLQNPICEFSSHVPSFPPSQVHIVMWERQNRRGNAIVMDTVTNLPMTTQDITNTTVPARLIYISTTTVPPGVTTAVPPGVTTVVSPGVTTAVPPGVTVLTGPVIMTPAFITTNTSGTQQQSPALMTVSQLAVPAGMPFQPATTSVAVAKVTGSRTKTSKNADNPRLQRCREKFERAKAMQQCAVAQVLIPSLPTVLCLPNLLCRQPQTNLPVIPPSTPVIVNQLSVTAAQVRPQDKTVSHGMLVSSSQNPQENAPVTVTTSSVKSAARVIRAVPVFAGYTAKSGAHKRSVNSSGEGNTLSSVNCANIPSAVKASTLSTANCAPLSAGCGGNLSSSGKYTLKTNSDANKSLLASSSATTSATSTASCTNTAMTTASKKRVIGQFGGNDKRRRLSTHSTHQAVSTRVTKCVTSLQTQPDTASCSPTQVDTSQVHKTDDSDKLTDVLDELCSTLDMSDVSQCVVPDVVFDCDDVIDFDSLLAV